MKSLSVLRPFDTSTNEGRSRERYRRALLTTLASGLAKVISVLTNLVSVPLTLHYLGTERFGLWITIGSFISFLGFSDLGIGNGLLNGISKSHGKGEDTLARQYVSSAFFSLTALAIMVGAIFAGAYNFVPWQSFFHLRSWKAIDEAGPAVAVSLACFLMNVPAGVVTRIQSGYQEGFMVNLWAAAGSVIALLALLLVIRARAPLPLLVLAIAGSPLITLFVNSAVVFGWQRPWLRPSWSHVKRDVSKDLVRNGFLFFVLQLAMAVGYSSDNLVLAQILGPEAVTQYAIPAKLFGTISIGCLLISAPLWPAYSEALAKGDTSWIRKTLLKSVFISVAFALTMNLMLLAFWSKVFSLWIGPNIHPSSMLLIGLGTWGIIYALSVPIAMLLNAATVVTFQVIVSSTGALVNIALSTYLTKRIGVPGVVFGSIVSQVIVVLIPYFLYTRIFLGSLRCVERQPISAPAPSVGGNPVVSAAAIT